MTPTDRDLFEHPTDACPLGELCPDLYPREQSDQAFGALCPLTIALVQRDIPPALVIWHLLAAALVMAHAHGIDSGTILRAVQFGMDEVQTQDETEPTPPERRSTV
jgi:hypothetical protein